MSSDLAHANRDEPLTADATDASLIERLLAGDQAAYRELVAQYHKSLLSIARAIVGEAIADEVVQEAWVSVFKALPGFERRSSLKTWLIRIVSNEAKGRLRRERRYVSLDDEDSALSHYLNPERFHADGHWAMPPPHWHIDSPDALLEESQLQRCIEKTLELLPPRQKAVFLLRDVEQQPLDGICNILDIGESNVRVLLHRARLKLMEVIDRYQETGEC